MTLKNPLLALRLLRMLEKRQKTADCASGKDALRPGLVLFSRSRAGSEVRDAGDSSRRVIRGCTHASRATDTAAAPTAEEQHRN